MGVTFKGCNELRVALEKKINMDAAKSIVRKHGAGLQQKAQYKAPVDTGTLQRSITLELSDGGMTATVAPGTEYAGYVEYGTRYMNAQPYVRPAFNEQKTQFKADLDRLVR